ncbi:MAG: lipid II flippase MurJ, partial [Pseudomonadota bacterium]
IGLAMALTLPAAVALAIVPTALIDGLFGRGAFTDEDAVLSASALVHFAWGVPAFVLIKVLAPGFFAREDTKTPMRFALVSVVINTVLGAGLFFWFRSTGAPGFPGLAIATSAAAWVNALLLFSTLGTRGWYSPGRRLISRLVSCVFASAAMAVGLVWLVMNEEDMRAYVPGGAVFDVLALIGAGALAYGVAAIVFGALRLSDVKALVGRRAVE